MAVAGLMLGSVANAIVIQNWERPIKGAQLTADQDTAKLPGANATYLTMNKRDDSSEPTSFTLQEDTGIRCITVPCPSTRDVQFKITAILPAIHNHDVLRYEAIEVLKHIPANVRIARRHLTVTESSMELVAPGGNGFMRREVWDVEVAPFAQNSQFYYGNPQALASIQ